MLDILEVDYLSVLIAGIVSMLLGGIWYHTSCFGKKWAAAHNYDISCLKGDFWSYLLALINSLIIAWMFAVFYNALGISSLLGAIWLAFLTWFGFVATTQFSGVVWAKKPLNAYFIDAGFFLCALLGISLTYWIFSFFG